MVGITDPSTNYRIAIAVLVADISYLIGRSAADSGTEPRFSRRTSSARFAAPLAAEKHNDSATNNLASFILIRTKLTEQPSQ